MKHKDNTEVSDDHIKLAEIMDAYGINVKRLSQKTGRACSTLYKYLAGEATIPSIVWRALFEMTKDSRIVSLITGEVPVMMVPLYAGNLRVDKATLEHLLEVRKKQIECEQYVLKILADGRVDSSDKAAVKKYRERFPAMISSQSQVYQAITGEYKLNGTEAKNDH